jgi:hypothetical protein
VFWLDYFWWNNLITLTQWLYCTVFSAILPPKHQTGCCEHGNEPSVSINCGKFIDYLGTVSFLFSLPWCPRGERPPHYREFLITLRHTTLIRALLDEWWAWRRDFYLTTHITHKSLTSLPLVGFEPTIPASERPQNHALDCAATGIGWGTVSFSKNTLVHGIRLLGWYCVVFGGLYQIILYLKTFHSDLTVFIHC